MANKNNDGVDNALDCSTEAGSDKSFVGKFVSGLISNTPLSKWFKSEETTRSATRRRDDDDDDPFTLQPPVKRPKLPSQHGMERNNYSAHTFANSSVIVQNTSNNVNNVASKVFNSFPEPVAGPSGIKSRKFFMGYNATTDANATLDTPPSRDAVNGDNDSDSEESTSGYSTGPRVTKVEINVESKEVLNRTELLDRSRFSSRSLFSSTHDVNNSRSLFSERSLSPQVNTSLSSRRPNFNASTFGSPNFVDRTLSTKRIMSSPFYNGKTIYGGASAYTKSQSSADLNASTRSSVLIKPVNQKAANDNTAMSKTARRILSTLEQYSTPISDAKKIPVSTKTDNQKGILSKYVGANPYLVRQPKTPSNKELQVPSIPELLQLKQKERLQNSTVSVRQMATSSKSSLNKPEYNIRTKEDEKSRNKHCNKMKSSVVSVRQKTQPEETVAEVKLPKVALPITTLPKFDFVLPAPKSHEKTKSSPAKAAPESKYKFSSPLVISESPKPVPAINCFKFSEPVSKKINGASCLNFKMPEKSALSRVKSNGENVKSLPQLVSGSVNDVFNKTNKDSSLDKFKPAEGTWECSTCLVRNTADKSKCVACETSKVCQISKDKPEVKANGPGFGNLFQLSKDKWECGTCMVRNDNSSQSCVACTTPKVGNSPQGQGSKKSEEGSSKSEIPSLNNKSFGNSFKPASDTWECKVCLIRNKNELEKCAACETSRGAKAAVTAKPVSSFGDKFKPPPGTWECSACMLRNSSDSNKCTVCETPKPGVKASAQPTFTFGIKPLDWECKGCKAKNSNATKCASCHKPKEEANGFGDSFKIKTDEWECSSCMVRNKADIVICACCGVPKPGTSTTEKLNELTEKKPVISFNFGINQSSGEFKFGIPATTENAAQPVPLIFGETETSKPAPPAEGFSFGIKTQEPPKSSSNPLLKPNENLPEKAEPAPTGFKFDVSNQKSPESTKNKWPQLPQEKSTPDLQWKLPPINGETGSKDLFANKPATNFAAPPSSDVTFQFESTPLTSNVAPAAAASSSLFKFGSQPTQPSNKRSMDATKDFSTSNGFGSPAKLPSFETTKAPAPAFGSGIAGSSKPFTFASGEPVSKSASFAFEQNPTAAPAAFRFGSGETGATAAAAAASGFNFSVTSVPSTGFNFGAKSEPAPSNSPAPPNVFGAAGPNAGAKNGSYFGSIPNNNQKAVFTFGASQMNPPSYPQSQTGFNFGSAAPAPASGGFNFTGAPPTFNLSDGNAATGQPVRKMRKAIRRSTQR